MTPVSVDRPTAPYLRLHEDFYDEQLQSLNPVRRWYHRSRYEHVRRTIRRLPSGGVRILDIGSGNGAWNAERVPIYGCDLNASMLLDGREKDRFRDAFVALTYPLPIRSRSIDLVLMMEVLEHLVSPEATLAEVQRVLKPGGRLFVTVPFDFLLSPFQILFGLQCAFQGWIRDDPYYRAKCGHVQHYRRGNLARLMGRCGFVNDSMFVVNGMLIYSVWRAKVGADPDVGSKR